MTTYEEFLKHKAIIDTPTGIALPTELNSNLFDWQQVIVRWALMRGRAALFEGTGLGKTPQQCEWSRQVEAHTSKPVLIVAPLAVAHQTIAEAMKIIGLIVKFAHCQSDVGEHGVYITNYQKLDKFNPRAFGGIALDESSILKSIDGSTKQRLIDDWTVVPFRLACTATPAPNDYMELGNHAEFLGVMKATEMLSTFFVHDGGETQKWRLKGHAERDFWKWMASWAVCIKSPADIGFDGSAYALPPLRMHEVFVDVEQLPIEGELFAMPAKTLDQRRHARKISIAERVEKCAEIVNASTDGQWLTWCGLNSESDECAKATKSENVQGSDSDERKEKIMLGFASGDVSRLTSKLSIAGWGMNWQRCHQMVFVGLNDSFEGMYQGIRRCWRYGQIHPVDVYIILSATEGAVLENIKRKEAEAESMQRAMVEHMADLTKRELGAGFRRTKIEYLPMKQLQLPTFLK